MARTKEIAFVTIILLIILGAVLGINYLKKPDIPNNQNNSTEEIMKCIAENSQLVVSKTCGHCANQKKMLEPYLDYFEILDLADHPEIYYEYGENGRISIPLWIIHREAYTGEHSIEQLKQLTGC
jgi:tRNA(Leu) C34 or U34 (ribose-2'-O)-methylase TrmL